MDKTFKGVHIPMITPYLRNGEVSEVLIKKLTDFYVNSGVACLVPTANNGEQPLLTKKEKKIIWTSVVESAANRVSVAPSITGNSTEEVVEFAQLAQSIGADGVMMAPPYYFKASEEELFDHYAKVADSISIPLIIHNEPAIFKSDISPELVARLNEIDNISLIKESTDNTQRIHEIVRLCGDRIIVIVAGGGTALESILLGARAWMTGLNNLIPKASVSMFNLAAEARRFDEARSIYFKNVLPLHSCLKKIGKAVPSIKFGLGLVLGTPVGDARQPLHPLTEKEKEFLKETLIEVGAI